MTALGHLAVASVSLGAIMLAGTYLCDRAYREAARVWQWVMRHTARLGRLRRW